MRTDVTFRLVGSLVAATVALAMTSCSSGSSSSMPVPEPSVSASAGALAEDPEEPVGGAESGWLVEAENVFVSASTRICSYEDVLTASEPEFFAIGLESNGGLPDDWDPNEMYQVDINSITLDFEAGTYAAYRFDGDITTGLGATWETYFAPFTFERDANGVISGGSGGGPARLLRADGNSERFDDAMTFTVSVIDDPPWCDI